MSLNGPVGQGRPEARLGTSGWVGTCSCVPSAARKAPGLFAHTAAAAPTADAWGEEPVGETGETPVRLRPPGHLWPHPVPTSLWSDPGEA